LFVAAAAWPVFYGKSFLQENKLLVATWIPACLVMSTFTLLPAIKVEDVTLMYVYRIRQGTVTNFRNSLFGGTWMVLIGVLYLIFEKSLLEKSKLTGDSTAPADNTLSRSLIGVQVRELSFLVVSSC